MRFKHNPWVSMVALALLGAILLWFCTGCDVAAEEGPLPTFTEAEEAPPRFTCENETPADQYDICVYVLTDTETGVEYLITKLYDNGVCVTALQPRRCDHGMGT